MSGKKFEYFTGWLVAEFAGPDEEGSWLNDMGKDGWELVSVGYREHQGLDSIFYYFKREIQDEDGDWEIQPRFRELDLKDR